jgi:hypothetical protein
VDSSRVCRTSCNGFSKNCEYGSGLPWPYIFGLKCFSTRGRDHLPRTAKPALPFSEQRPASQPDGFYQQIAASPS